jgi:hypothetical protein
MNKLGGLFIGKALICKLSLFLATFLLLTSTAQSKIYDDFSGTTIDPAKWNLSVNSGPPGQFWQNNGLYYSGSTGNGDSSLTSPKSIKEISGASNFVVTVQFREFSSTTSYPRNYEGPSSQFRVSIHPPSTHDTVAVFRAVNPMGPVEGAVHQFCAIYQNIDTNEFQGYVHKNTSATSGQLRLSLAGGVVTASYNETLDPKTGWQQLATFTPPWGSDSPILILGGTDAVNGTTTFEVDKVSITSSSMPPLLLLID